LAQFALIVQAGFQRTDALNYEGIVVKALEAPYYLGRPPAGEVSWIKWKRDFFGAWDADVLIVGGMFGSKGERAGITKYLCALRGPADDHRKLYWTFVRLHTGLTVCYH
jgi:ATP-dependent DNA ligase